MMKSVQCLSELLLPTLREDPGDAEIVSHRLMLRAGMIRQEAAGIYSWLPAGFRVLKKIEQIVREEQDRIGGQEILMPTIQPADLWRRSGRYDDYGKEMLRIQDRSGRDMLYGPTNEEMVTDLFAGFCRSWRDVPKMLYHIQWKFRDELRPRFGIMRGREFLMKDAYSFDLDAEAGEYAYRLQFLAYLRTFKRLGVAVVPMAADTGPIGGDLSHEFIMLAETGESSVWCDRAALAYSDDMQRVDSQDQEALKAFVERVTGPYAATDEQHDPAVFASRVAEGDRYEGRGVEVGHIFHFGDKYSTKLNANLQDPTGNNVPALCGSYGIGVSRLVGALIEAGHDDKGIVWNSTIAPWAVHMINLKPGHTDCDGVIAGLLAGCTGTSGVGLDVLVDDRDERAGVKFSDADLLGLPFRLTVGPKHAAAQQAEWSLRAGGETHLTDIDGCIRGVRDAWSKERMSQQVGAGRVT